MVTGSAPLQSHDIYDHVFNFEGVNCCHGKDCHMILDAKDVVPLSGGYRLRSTGEVIQLPQTGFSPDANWHICRRDDTKAIRCLLVPAGGS